VKYFIHINIFVKYHVNIGKLLVRGLSKFRTWTICKGGYAQGKRMKELNLQLRSAVNGAWRARLVGNGGRTRDLLLASDVEVRPPVALDGLAAAALPVAMRGKFDVLRVHGPVTHGALWRLLEYARIWHLWSPEQFHPTRIEAQSVLNGQAPDAAAPALVAWSGSVHSSYTLVRMLEHQVAGAPAVGGVVRISGIRPGDGKEHYRVDGIAISSCAHQCS
jgi:hypothetical protein